MNTIQVSLPDEIEEWVEKEVQTGGFATPSDYIQDLLREAKARQQVEKQLLAGLESGERQIANNQWWHDLHSEIEREEAA